MTDKTERRFVLLGNVDSGKSTLGGQILVTSGLIEAREIEKVKKEAESRKMSSWWLAYLLDSDDGERARGKTHEYLDLVIPFKDTQLTMIDVPGHKQLISEMVLGCSQANIALLILSARQGEYKSGLAGQTVEHCVIARGMGISTLVVAVNKMDTIDWDEETYQKLKKDFQKRISKYQFKSIKFVPISAYQGSNVNDIDPTSVTTWKTEKIDQSLMEIISEIPFKEVHDKNIIVGEKKILVCKFLAYKIPTLICTGLVCKIHTKDQLYDVRLVKLRVESKKEKKSWVYLTDSNDPKGLVDACFCLIGKNVPEEVNSNLVVRNGDQTIGIAKVIKSI